MTFIEMPKLSDTMTEGTLVKWLKQEGDAVEIGDVIAEVETDKATMEMEAFDEGTLGKIYVPAGEKVAIGSRLAVLIEEGEEAPDSPGGADGGQAVSGGTQAPPAGAESPGETGAGKGKGGPQAPPAGTSGGRVKASPLARKIATEHGIDLGLVSGTGPGGRIVKKDVLAAVEKGGAAGPGAGSATPASAPVATPAPIRAEAGAEDQRLPLSGMRAIIAERLLASKTQIPHFYLHIEVDAAPLMALRRELNGAAAEKPDANQYTVNDFVLRAVVAAAVEVPAVNASFAGDHIVQFAGIHLAVAVAVDDGLVTPVVRNAQNKSLLALSLAVKDLAGRARNKRLAPDEMQGGTLTVSNLGAYGIRSFDAIINPPQAAILAVGAIRETPVVVEGAVVPGLRMDIGLSGDHRVVDGAVGAQFLAALRKFLEQPALMLV